EPGAAAEADAHVGAVGDFQGALVAGEVAEDAARDAGKDGDGRVVGVDPDPDADLLGDRDHLADEIGIVLPDLILGEHAAVGERLLPALARPGSSLVRARQVEFACGGASYLGTAAGPDAVAHVGVGCEVDVGRREIAEVLLVLLDLLVASGEVERDL